MPRITRGLAKTWLHRNFAASTRIAANEILLPCGLQKAQNSREIYLAAGADDIE